MRLLSSAALLASLTAAGCAATPPDILPAIGPQAATAGIRDTHHHEAVRYTHREPVSPENWRRLNERVAPSSQEAGS